MNILLILLLSTGAGRQFYVAPGGSDSAVGSAQHPWATISHAGRVVAPGDTVNVASGTYNENVYLNVSGTSSAPTTFVSDVPWGAKIRSTTAIFAWETHGNYVTIQGFDISGEAANVWDGIVNYGSHCQFIGNYVHDIPATASGSNGGSGIAMENMSAVDNDVIGNVVGNIGVAGNDSQGIYYSNYGGNCRNNIAYSCARWGIQVWHAAQHININNNLCFNNQSGGIVVGTGDSGSGGSTGDYNVVTNNICYGNNVGIREAGLPSSDTHNIYLNNCVHNNRTNWMLQWNSHAGDVTADPKFVNYQANGSGPWAGGTADYHLASGSPCLGAGTSKGKPPTDIDGVPRPQGSACGIGPYEWVPPSARPRRPDAR